MYGTLQVGLKEYQMLEGLVGVDNPVTRVSDMSGGRVDLIL